MSFSRVTWANTIQPKHTLVFGASGQIGALRCGLQPRAAVAATPAASAAQLEVAALVPAARGDLTLPERGRLRRRSARPLA